MLQNLSKCEDKVPGCGNFTIGLPHRFYVKSNLGEFKRSKNVIFGTLELLNFNFGKSQPFFKSQICQNSKMRVSEIVQMAILEIQILPKIWFHAKLSGKQILVLWILTSHFERFMEHSATVCKTRNSLQGPSFPSLFTHVHVLWNHYEAFLKEESS